MGLRTGGQTIAVTHTDTQGNFLISAPPGQYEISIGHNLFFGVHIYAADLHEGQQSLQPVRFSMEPDRSQMVDFVTGGEVIAAYKYPEFAHRSSTPERYLKHLRSLYF